MRKILVSVLLMFSFVMPFSCETEDVEATVSTVVDLAAADASAFGEASLACLETNLGFICRACCYELGAAAAVIGSAYAATYKRTMNSGTIPSRHIESEIILPDSFKIASNPYECAGVIHNRLLFEIMNGNSEQKIQDILSGNQAALERIVQISSDCQPIDPETQTQIIENLRQGLTLSNYQENLLKYKNISREELFSGNGTSVDAEYYVGVYDEVITLKNNSGNSITTILNFFNRKLSELLNNNEPMDSLKTSKLGFLSVFKHSYYYWNK